VRTSRYANAWSAALLLVACAQDNPARRGDRVDVSSYPPEIQSAYRVFAVRCSRCHTLARPLNARISDPQHWIRYVTRMRRQPGSGINSSNAQIILRFLLYYHDPQRLAEHVAPVQEPRAPSTAPPSEAAAPSERVVDASVAPAYDVSPPPPAAAEPPATPSELPPAGAESLGTPAADAGMPGMPDRRSP
jgi:hypothetical protein